ncbi:MAG: MCE family protein [Smithella sp.]|jgi:phospholipid/cholesterol/gamma-HCH transport system substrate-binding protein|nr:MCE family protein [Smithella sp.]
MTTNSAKFLIGLFVIVGALIFAAIIIWVGAAKYFAKGSLYAVYFDESVQGLQVDSAIKYRGVAIGNVKRIDVAPDYRLIEVIMKINLGGDMARQTIASLKTAGITGVVFIELDQISEGELSRSPQLSFKPPYPVIPSRLSEISRFVSDAGDVMQKIGSVDFQGISDDLKQATGAIKDFVQGKRIQNIMENLDSASSRLDETIARINRTIAEGMVDQTIQEALGVLTDARRLISQADGELQALNLSEKERLAREILEDVDTKTKAITGELQDTAENLRVTSEHLKILADRLNRDPSELIFTKPAPPRKPME